MKVNNLTRLTITLSTLCLASTLFCSANAHTALKKGCEYASITHPIGAEMTMVGKPMVCTFAVLPNGKVGYQWAPLHSAVHKVALTKPLKVNGTHLPAGTHVGATLDADNNVDTYLHNMDAKFKAVRDADNALGMEMQTSSANHVRLLKNIIQNSPLYEFNLGVQTVSPKLSHVLNSTLAFYQRQRTNILLAELVAKQHEVTTKATIPFSTGKNSLLLHVHGMTIPFFQFVHDFHAQRYVQQCMIPVVRHGDVTIGQLHRAWNMFAILGNLNTNNTQYRLHHCKFRSHKWNDRLHHAPLRALHAAALLSAANRASTTPVNTISPVSMRATGDGITFIPECLDFISGKQSQTAYATIAASSPRERALGLSPAQQRALAEHNKASTHTQLSVSTDAKAKKPALASPLTRLRDAADADMNNMQSNDAVLSVGSGAITPAFSIDDFDKNLHALAQAMHDEATGLSASKKTGNVSTSACNGGVTVFPGDFNISEKQLIKIAKDALSESSNIFPTKTNSNVIHDEALGGYYWDGKPTHEIHIHVPASSYSAGNGGIDLYAVQQKAGQTA